LKGKTAKYTAQSSETFILNRMLSEKANGFVKRGVFSNEVVWGNYSYIFPKLEKEQQKSFRKGMFLFGMVRKDVKLFIQKNPIIKLPKKYSQIEYNKNINADLFGDITATDLNHAYWRIALNLNIISEKTYYKGIKDEFKAVRLAALSTMGANKKYQKIKDGYLVKEYMIVEGDEQMQMVYKLIRYTCYKYMNQVKKLLKKDFLCYKTDCIYYMDTEDNREIVNNFFIEKNLYMKQLTK